MNYIYRKKELMYIRYRVQKTLMKKDLSKPNVEVIYRSYLYSKAGIACGEDEFRKA